MFPVNGSAIVGQVQAHGQKMGVDLKKRYVAALDMVYSAGMGRLPEVPQFKPAPEDED